MTRKTIIITNALAAHLLGIVAAMTNTVASTNDVEAVTTIDSFTITHELEGEGPQVLLADRIHPNLFVVSFIGKRSFLDFIGSNGWQNSFDALYNYVTAIDPEVQINYDDFVLVDISAHYSAFAMPGEEVFFEELDTSMGPALIAALFEHATGDVAAAIDAAANDKIFVGDTAAETVQTTAEEALEETTEKGKTFKDSAKRTLRRAKNIIGGVTLIEVGFGVLAIAAVVVGHRYYRTSTAG